MAALADRPCRAHRAEMYRRLTGDCHTPLLVDELCYRGGETWPGLLPTRAQIEKERERMQADKDGLEIQQGVFLGHVMADPRCGTHLVYASLRPRPESLELIKTFRDKGVADLGNVIVEAKGRVGHVTVRNTRYLNAEDEETLVPQEIAVDLVLMHPDLQMGLLRGDFVEHPRYKGRRIFDAGLNLTKVYHGKIGYASFYILRDLGLVNKLLRGLAMNAWHEGLVGGNEPEDTLEKPWVAALEGFAIGGGCQLLLVVDYVIAEAGSYFNLPARKEGIIPGAANLRLARFVGERMARQGIMFDKTFYVESPEARLIVNEVVPRERMDAAIDEAVENALMSGMVSASGNRKALRVEAEPVEAFRRYMATYCAEQAMCHLSPQLVSNLEKNWNAKSKKL
jgi:thioesterase DpgC